MSSDLKLEMMQEDKSIGLDKVRLGVLSAGHLVGDMYVSFLAPLWPLLIPKLGLSLTSVGLFTTVTGVLLTPVQPLTGWIVDRFSGGWYMVFGLAGVAVFMSLLGLVPSYGLLILCVLLGRIANSMFHPDAAVMVRTTGSGREGTATSVFAFAGTIGVSVGPLLIVAIVTRFGLEATYLVMPIGLLLALLVYLHGRTPIEESTETSKPLAGSEGSTANEGGAASSVRPLLLLTGLMTMRAAVFMGFRTFVPVYLVDDQGASVMMGGIAMSVLTLFGAFGGLAGGYFSDRFGMRSRLIAFSFLTTAAAIFAFLHVSGALSMVVLVILGLALFASQPVSVVLAQELAPGQMALASGLMMGLVYGVGSLVMTPVGVLADAAGIAAGLLCLAGLAVLSGLASLMLPERRSAAQ